MSGAIKLKNFRGKLFSEKRTNKSKNQEMQYYMCFKTIPK